jgi:hypothetical protein
MMDYLEADNDDIHIRKKYMYTYTYILILTQVHMYRYLLKIDHSSIHFAYFIRTNIGLWYSGALEPIDGFS